MWPTDGTFPLSTTLDSLGTFTDSAEDAALAFAALTARPVPRPKRLKGLRLGRPTNHYFDDLSPEVAAATEGALRALRDAGVEIVPIEVPEAAEIDTVFGPLLSVELLATLGSDRFVASREILDPVVWNRAEPHAALHGRSIMYARAVARSSCARSLEKKCAGSMAGSRRRPRIHPCRSPITARRRRLRHGFAVARTTHARRTCSGSAACPCRSRVPACLSASRSCARTARTQRLLSISRALEELLGRRARPDMSGFL